MPALLAIWSKVPSFLKWLALVLLVGIGAFLGGRYSKPAEVITKVEKVTEVQQVEVVKWQTKTEYQDRIVTKYVTQATLKQDKDTDCTEDFSPTTGKLVKRHCITKTATDTTHTNTGGSDTTHTGGTTSSGEQTVVIKEVIKEVTVVDTKNTLGISGNWGLSVFADGTVLDHGKAGLTPSYGVGLAYKLVGPVYATASIASDKVVLLGASLSLGENWQVGAQAGSKFDKLAPFYGGDVQRHLFGPLWVGAWGYSDQTFGLSLSLSVK